MVVAVLVSILAGVTIVLSRTVNAELSKATSPIVSSLWNYLLGLGSALALFALICVFEGSPALPAATPKPWCFAGGVLGMAVVSLLNITVRKISAFYMTLFMFIGQVFTGVALDIVLSGQFSLGNLLGGAAVTAGLTYNLYVDRQSNSGPKVP